MTWVRYSLISTTLPRPKATLTQCRPAISATPVIVPLIRTGWPADSSARPPTSVSNGSPAFRPLATTASTIVRSAMVAISTSARSCAITCCSTHVAEPERSEWSASTAGQASRATASLASSTPSAMGCPVAVFSSASRRRHAHVATSSAALRASAGLPLVIAWTVVPDVGMTVQAMTNGKPALARKAADDVATWAWRRREALLKTATGHPIAEGVELAKEAVARDAWPAVLADHSDRSGSATWVLQQVIAQDLADVLIATIADRTIVEAVVAKGLKAGDPFDTDVGGLADESAGQPVRIKGTITGVADIAGRHWVSVAFGRGNVVLISEYLTQVMDPLDLTGPGYSIDQFKVFAIKSRVHFRRGFDDSGFAKTILLVEPEQPFLGTVRLEALPYRNVDISKFYPYGDVSFP